MHCKSCDYPLWNLKTRACPECGAAFSPSEFEFVVNTVRFCCPACDQTYYGTGEHGHLVPVEFNCVTCGSRVAMDQMVLRPAGGVTEAQTRVDRAPWLERQRIGFVRAFFGTIGQALVAPMKLMRGVPITEGAGQAWWFACIVLTATYVVSLLPMMLFMTLSVGVAGGGAGALQMLAPVAAFTAGAFGATLLLMAVWGLTAHGIIAVTGPHKAGLGRTMTAIGYSTGANVISAVPCVGGYAGWLWWVISATLMVKSAQNVSGWRASLAVLPLPVLLVGSIVVGFVMLMSWASSMGAMAARQAAAATPVQLETGAMISALNDYASTNGALPWHAAELLIDGWLAPADFISTSTTTSSRPVMVHDLAIDEFGRASYPKQASIVAALRKDITPQTVAHRLGDFVFTHHGMSVGQSDPRLWVVVLCPLEDENGPTASNPVCVGMLDGSTQVLRFWEIDQALIEQNAIRAAAGLAPLPDLRTVRQDKPASGAPPTQEVDRPVP